MDKYEYRIRSEEINRLIEKEKYEEAVAIADKIDWRRVKSATTLLKIAALYRANRRKEDCRAMLQLAYDRYPTNRSVVHSLCEISIEMDDVVAAIEYYKRFVKLAPRDNGVFTLRYRILAAQEASLEERIELLEELKKRDYQEEWAYELAYLYHRVGLATKCIEECDDLILWFGDGAYVIKAMELKMLHAPLTPVQQKKYEAMLNGVSSESVENDYNGYSQDAYADEDYQQNYVEEDYGNANSAESQALQNSYTGEFYVEHTYGTNGNTAQRNQDTFANSKYPEELYSSEAYADVVYNDEPQENANYQEYSENGYGEAAYPDQAYTGEMQVNNAYGQNTYPEEEYQTGEYAKDIYTEEPYQDGIYTKETYSNTNRIYSNVDEAYPDGTYEDETYTNTNGEYHDSAYAEENYGNVNGQYQDGAYGNETYENTDGVYQDQAYADETYTNANGVHQDQAYAEGTYTNADGVYQDQAYAEGAYTNANGVYQDQEYADGTYTNANEVYQDETYGAATYEKANGAYVDEQYQNGAYASENYANGAYQEETYQDETYSDETNVNATGFYQNGAYSDEPYAERNGVYAYRASGDKTYANANSTYQESTYTNKPVSKPAPAIVQLNDMSQYNTINLQKVVADGMKEISLNDSTEEDEPLQQPEKQSGFREIIVEDNTLPHIKRVAELLDGISEEKPGPDTGAIRKVILPGDKARFIKQEADIEELHNTTERSVSEEQSRIENTGENIFHEQNIFHPTAEQQQDPKAIIGAAGLENVLVEWERVKREIEQRRKEKVRQHVLSQTGKIFENFDNSIRSGILGELDKEEPEIKKAVEEEALLQSKQDFYQQTKDTDVYTMYPQESRYSNKEYPPENNLTQQYESTEYYAQESYSDEEYEYPQERNFEEDYPQEGYISEEYLQEDDIVENDLQQNNGSENYLYESDSSKEDLQENSTITDIPEHSSNVVQTPQEYGKQIFEEEQNNKVVILNQETAFTEDLENVEASEQDIQQDNLNKVYPAEDSVVESHTNIIPIDAASLAESNFNKAYNHESQNKKIKNKKSQKPQMEQQLTKVSQLKESQNRELITNETKSIESIDSQIEELQNNNHSFEDSQTQELQLEEPQDINAQPHILKPQKMQNIEYQTNKFQTEESRIGYAQIEDPQIENSQIEDSQIEDSQIEDSQIGDSQIENSQIEDSQIEDSQIEDSQIEDSQIEDSQIEDSQIEYSQIEDSQIEDSQIEYSQIEDSQISQIEKFQIEDSQIKKFQIEETQDIDYQPNTHQLEEDQITNYQTEESQQDYQNISYQTQDYQNINYQTEESSQNYQNIDYPTEEQQQDYQNINYQTQDYQNINYQTEETQNIPYQYAEASPTELLNNRFYTETPYENASDQNIQSETQAIPIQNTTQNHSDNNRRTMIHAEAENLPLGILQAEPIGAVQVQPVQAVEPLKRKSTGRLPKVSTKTGEINIKASAMASAIASAAAKSAYEEETDEEREEFEREKAEQIAEMAKEDALKTQEIKMNTADLSSLSDKIMATTKKEATGAKREDIREFTQEEQELFENFAVTKKIKKQILYALDNMSLAGFTGNVIVTGDAGLDTVRMAKNLARRFQQLEPGFSGKIAKITGEKINIRNLKEIFDKLANGAIIIEKANGILEEKLYEMAMLLNRKNFGLVVIMEDTRKEITKLLKKQAMIADYFNIRIDLMEMDNNALVAYARNYALALEYSIDELGILALYTRIANIQSGNHVVTKDEVRDIIDEAIWKSKKSKVKNFVDVLFSKRYDSQDMIVLKERDFI
ncbi:MAG: hypothetical protein HFJ08_18310 [Lachnospiraceae bacterium]|nr:hypothetical protein [Lachnospiraceae bacterium]